MRNSLLALALLLAGCDRNTWYPAVSNDYIIRESKRCTDAGLDFEIVTYTETRGPFAVHCTKPGAKK